MIEPQDVRTAEREEDDARFEMETKYELFRNNPSNTRFLALIEKALEFREKTGALETMRQAFAFQELYKNGTPISIEEALRLHT